MRYTALSITLLLVVTLLGVSIVYSLQQGTTPPTPTTPSTSRLSKRQLQQYVVIVKKRIDKEMKLGGDRIADLYIGNKEDMIDGAVTICVAPVQTLSCGCCSFDLENVPFYDDDLDVFMQTEKVRHLSVSRTQITNAGLGFIAQHPELMKLDLSKNKIDDDGLERLAGLANLRSLSLAGNWRRAPPPKELEQTPGIGPAKYTIN